MKKVLLILFVVAGIGGLIWWKQSHKTPSPDFSINTETAQKESPQQRDFNAIRSFMAEPNLDLISKGTGLPQPYFMVGKASPLDKSGGITIEKVPEWERQVNIYEQKNIVNGQCGVYEYQTDVRNNILTAVHIRNLQQSEIGDLKANGVSCGRVSTMPKMSKTEAETIAFDYLERALPNFDQIKDQLVYSEKLGGESHEWRFEDKSFKLPEGLTGDPYSYPIIRIVIYGDKSILYENTTTLFED